MTHIKQSWTNEETAILVKNYPHKGYEWCTEKLSRSKCSVRRKASSLNLKVTKERKSQAQREISDRCRPNLCNVDASMFESVINKECAYIMGLLWADGWITKKHVIGLEIKSSDYKSVKPVFNFVGKWTEYERKRPNRHLQTSAKTSNRKLYGIFEDLGYGGKSLASADRVIGHVPDHLRHYWWRGYFDGDGCFYVGKKGVRQMSIAGSYNQDWSSFSDLCRKLNVKHASEKRKQKQKNGKLSSSSVVRMSSMNDIVPFGRYIYQGIDSDQLGFKRKHDKFKMIEKAYDDRDERSRCRD